MYRYYCCCCFVLQCSLVTCCQSCVVCIEYPFAKDDEAKRAAQQDVSAPAFLASPRAENVPNLVNEQLLQAHMMKMSAMSTMSSFHGDNPFSGWVVLVFALHREEKWRAPADFYAVCSTIQARSRSRRSKTRSWTWPAPASTPRGTVLVIFESIELSTGANLT